MVWTLRQLQGVSWLEFRSGQRYHKEKELIPMKKTLVVLAAFALFIGSFFLIWFDYKVQRDLTGLDFVSRYRYLLMGLAALAVILASLGQYAMISGLFVLLFLAQLFYASSKNLNRLAPGFFVSLALTIVTGIVVMTMKDKARPNVIYRQRMKAASGRVREADAEDDPAPPEQV